MEPGPRDPPVGPVKQLHWHIGCFDNPYPHFSFLSEGGFLMAQLLEAPPTRQPKVQRHHPQEIAGSVEKVVVPGRFLQVRFGREPGEYVIFHIPHQCVIHRAGERMPLKDVQFCDSVSIRFRKHPQFDVQLAHEIEVNE